MGCEYNCNLFSLEQLSQGKNKVFVSVLKQNKILHFTIGKNKIHFDFVKEGILSRKSISIFPDSFTFVIKLVKWFDDSNEYDSFPKNNDFSNSWMWAQQILNHFILYGIIWHWLIFSYTFERNKLFVSKLKNLRFISYWEFLDFKLVIHKFQPVKTVCLASEIQKSIFKSITSHV